MRRTILLILGLSILGLAWLGPLPDLAHHSFAAHMTMHMAVVAVSAPFVAFALAGTAGDAARAVPRLAAPLSASIVELIVVWGWHLPALHNAARQETWALVLEQGSFLAAGLLLWMAVIGGDVEACRSRRGEGIVALLLTSMHMTLLGALFALANRPLFRHGPETATALSALADQHLGGAIMLLVGGTSYLAGGLWLTARILRPSVAEQARQVSR